LIIFIRNIGFFPFVKQCLTFLLHGWCHFPMTKAQCPTIIMFFFISMHLPFIVNCNMFTMFDGKIWMLFPSPYLICIIPFSTSTIALILIKSPILKDLVIPIARLSK
jgi:hypothetical protein